MKDRMGILLKEKAQERMNEAMERADCVFRTEKDCRLVTILLEEHFSEILFLSETIEYIEYQKKQQTASRYRGIKG